MRENLKRLLSLCMVLGLLCGTVSAAEDGAGEGPVVEEEAGLYMTYRDNDVVLQASNGIQIVEGSFQVKDFRITSGQDPDGENFVGQLHPLNNGTFRFRVGRSGSESVAAWFNEKFSGFNDASVTGDRTTFDQTAGSLNFAFFGDLALEVSLPGESHTISVLFPDVAFAQGSTALRNNWWFAQLAGQHTLDSDGADRLLTIGTDENGGTVYASFLRGDNGVNVVSLEALYRPGPAEDLAPRVSSVRDAFHALPVNGTLQTLNGFPGNYDPTVNHIQGFARYESAAGGSYALMTHSVATSSYAHILAGPVDSSEKWGFKTYRKDWKHPGGIQGIGDYLLVPSEQDTEAHIALYDLRSLEVQELRRVEGFDLAVDHKAGALGITSYTDGDGTEYYLLIVAHLDGENSVYHIYRAAAAGGLENAAFTEVGSFPFEKDFQGFGLVTEAETNDVYLIGLWSPGEGATFADYAYLYQIDTQNWTMGEELDQIHMVSSGGAVGVLGVHFRYGAGLYVTQDHLTISATERNTVLGSGLAVNDWGC